MERTIIYRDARGEVTARTITPLEETPDHVVALCHLRGAQRTFRRDRIVFDNVAYQDVERLLVEADRLTNRCRGMIIAIVGVDQERKYWLTRRVEDAQGEVRSRFRPDLTAVVTSERGMRSRTVQDALARGVPVVPIEELEDFLVDGVVPAAPAPAHQPTSVSARADAWSRVQPGPNKRPAAPAKAQVAPAASQRDRVDLDALIEAAEDEHRRRMVRAIGLVVGIAAALAGGIAASPLLVTTGLMACLAALLRTRGRGAGDTGVVTWLAIALCASGLLVALAYWPWTVLGSSPILGLLMTVGARRQR